MNAPTRVSKAGNITLRIAGRLHHIGIGKTYAGTYVLLLVHDQDIRIIDVRFTPNRGGFLMPLLG